MELVSPVLMELFVLCALAAMTCAYFDDERFAGGLKMFFTLAILLSVARLFARIAGH